MSQVQGLSTWALWCYYRQKKDNSVLAAVSRGSRNLRRMVAQNHKQQDKHKFLDAGSVMIKYFDVGLFPREDVRK